MFHVKDAEFNPTGKSGVYGGYQDWVNRPGRFRSLGDGQVDFKAIFSKLTQYGFGGWAVLEWECCMKHPEQGAAEGAPFIKNHIIRVTEKAFDDFASACGSQARGRIEFGIVDAQGGQRGDAGSEEENLRCVQARGRGGLGRGVFVCAARDRDSQVERGCAEVAVVVRAKPDSVSAKPDSVPAKPEFGFDSADRAVHASPHFAKLLPLQRRIGLCGDAT